MCFQTQMPFIFVISFFRHRAVLPIYKEQFFQTSTVGQSRIIFDNFSKYYMPLHKLVSAVDAIQKTKNCQNAKITNRQHFLFVCGSSLYIWSIWFHYGPFGNIGQSKIHPCICILLSLQAAKMSERNRYVIQYNYTAVKKFYTHRYHIFHKLLT